MTCDLRVALARLPEHLEKQPLRLLSTLFGHHDGLCRRFRILNPPPLVEAIHHIPILPLPRSDSRAVGERSEIEKSKNRPVDLVGVVVHGFGFLILVTALEPSSSL